MSEGFEAQSDSWRISTTPRPAHAKVLALGPDHRSVEAHRRSRRSEKGNLLNHQNFATQDAAREVELLARAQQGEERAFEALFNAYRRCVYSLCLRMTGSGAEAEDLTQEAFLKVFRKISTFRGESTFSTWVHRIAINAVLTYMRNKRFESGSLNEGRPWQRTAGKAPSRPLRSVEQRIDRMALDEAIASLPPHHRAVFVLHDVEEREHREIAQMVNCSIARSRSLLHEARLRLRKRLSNGCLARLEPQSVGTRY